MRGELQAREAVKENARRVERVRAKHEDVVDGHAVEAPGDRVEEEERIGVDIEAAEIALLDGAKDFGPETESLSSKYTRKNIGKGKKKESEAYMGARVMLMARILPRIGITRDIHTFSSSPESDMVD